MTGGNPYQAYTEGSVFSDQPLRLVVALYEGALDATRQAANCLAIRDIWGRGKAINKAIAICSELLVSLDEEKGGEIARNLKRLYLYMQKKLIEAHSRQAAPPLREVEKLLDTMLEGWREAAASRSAQDRSHLPLATLRAAGSNTEAQQPYADYLGQDVEESASPVFSF
jgi:flagellar protein FliS